MYILAATVNEKFVLPHKIKSMPVLMNGYVNIDLVGFRLPVVFPAVCI